MKLHILSILSAAILLFGCQNNNIKTVEGVQSAGALHNVMSGKLEAAISLSELKDIPNLYALGPVEGLKGEIQIFNSKPYVSQVSPNQLDIDTTFGAKAAMLVYAQVPEWQEISIPKAILTLQQFEGYLPSVARREGIDISKPFPFMIEGNVRKLGWHVVDWDENSGMEHSHKSHQLTGLKGVTMQDRVKIIGFYSTGHTGVYVPHDSNWHMHFVLGNERVAGHLDELLFGEYMTLKLPKTD